jgi:hypothetical protein
VATITPLHFPSQGQELLQEDATDDCPVEVMQVYFRGHDALYEIL